MLAPWEKSYDQPRQHIKKQRHYFSEKVPFSQSYGFSSSHVRMWELDHKESWALKNWCFWTVVLEKTLESPLDCKKIKPVNPKGNKSWIFTWRTDAEAETPILWPSDAKNWFLRKDSDAGKDWRQEEKGKTEDEMVGGYHWLKGLEFKQAPGVGDGQGNLACCISWGLRDWKRLSDWTELKRKMNFFFVSFISCVNCCYCSVVFGLKNSVFTEFRTFIPYYFLNILKTIVLLLVCLIYLLSY